MIGYLIFIYLNMGMCWVRVSTYLFEVFGKKEYKYPHLRMFANLIGWPFFFMVNFIIYYYNYFMLESEK
jgi:hypothetical protein